MRNKIVYFLLLSLSSATHGICHSDVDQLDHLPSKNSRTFASEENYTALHTRVILERINNKHAEASFNSIPAIVNINATCLIGTILFILHYLSKESYLEQSPRTLSVPNIIPFRIDCACTKLNYSPRLLNAVGHTFAQNNWGTEQNEN